MEQIDVLLAGLIPCLMIIHLLIAPYTKVEESFNIQAIHDIVSYGLPMQNLSSTFQTYYDHATFPGAVPRTFVGAFVLAGVSKPFLMLSGGQYGQLIVRAMLGLFNAYALAKYKGGLERAFGKDVGRWYVLLQATQFHVMYYATRTLPNMFAFGLTTLALKEFLPARTTQELLVTQSKHRFGIFLFVFAGVVFRSEIAVLLFTQLIYLLIIQPRISLQTIVPAGLISAIIALAISVPIDSYFWQTPIWPELAGFYYNAIQGKSADWGTSPFAYYFTSLLPKLLLNPLILILLIPLGFMLPSTRFQCKDLVIPSLLFVVIYSLQPHKEARFIIYVVPSLTAAASLSASYIWIRRAKSVFYRAGSLLILASILCSFAASTIMLLISSLNYPGGDALSQLHVTIAKTNWSTANSSTPQNVSIHMDVLSCMTGITRFQEHTSTPIPTNNQPIHVTYDKTENRTQLLMPEFWAQFDYAIMEDPALTIGKWETVHTIFAYAGIEFLRPGDGSSFGEHIERVYAANNLTVTAEEGEEVAPSGEDVRGVSSSASDTELGIETNDGKEERQRRRNDKKAKLLFEEMGRFGTYNLVRDGVRAATGGWWIGPRMRPVMRVLKQIREPANV